MRKQIIAKNQFSGYLEPKTRRIRGKEAAKLLGISYHNYRKRLTLAKKKVIKSMLEYEQFEIAI